MNTHTIQSLRKRGFKVRVTHERVTGFVAENISSVRRPIVRAIPVFQRVTKEGRKQKLYPFIYGKGGVTTIEITNPEGVTTTETANCSIRDAFDRKLGNRICLARLAKRGVV